VDINFIDALRTSFYMQPNGGPYYYGTFTSLFALNGTPNVLRGPLNPQQGAAPPVPAVTPLGELAPAAGPGAQGEQPGAQPDTCAMAFMTNFWNWYRECQVQGPGLPQ
jgi:hypothetical protein